MKNRTLDLNKPEDARLFITEAMTECLPSKIAFLDTRDGKRKDVNTLNDQEAVQYAFELLPIYQAKFPDLVNVQYEH